MKTFKYLLSFAVLLTLTGCMNQANQDSGEVLEAGKNVVSGAQKMTEGGLDSMAEGAGEVMESGKVIAEKSGGLLDGARNVLGNIGDATESAINTVGETAGNVKDAAVDGASVVAETAGDAAGAVAEGATDLAEGAVEVAGDATEAVVDGAGAVTEGAVDAAGSAIEATGDVAGAVAEGATDLAEEAVDTVIEVKDAAVDVATSETRSFVYEEFTNDKLNDMYGQKVVINFRADWCPTCAKLEAKLEDEANADQLTNVNMLLADYDKETELKKKYNVNKQTTLVFLDEKHQEVKTIRDPELDEIANFFN